MDWTSVFAESGEEDLILPHLMEIHTESRLARLVSKEYHIKHDHSSHSDGCAEDENDILSGHHRLWNLSGISEEGGDDNESFSWSPTYTLKALYYLSINYVLGVGVLGIPYAFAHAGFLLCTLILSTVTLFSYITVMWVAETGSRLECEFHNRNQNTAVEDEDYEDEVETTHLLGIAAQLSPKQNKEKDRKKSILSSMDIDRYQVVDIVSYYLGQRHKLLYQVSLLSLMYIGLLAYSQVFCGAISELIWHNDSSIGTAELAGVQNKVLGLPQIIFGLIVVPLSCIELDEQVGVQSIMATFRFVAIFIMVGGSLVALFIDDQQWQDDDADVNDQSLPPYFAPAEPDDCQMSYTVCFSGFGVAFSTALFSQLFQHSIPGLLRPLRNQTEKIKKVPKVFAASLSTTYAFYLMLGMSAASYFGANTRSSVNLNFADFTFGLNPDTTPKIILVLLKIASNIVVIFPALDTLSVFPLIANTLGSNLLASSSPSFVRFIAKHLPEYDHMMKSISSSSQRIEDTNRNFNLVRRQQQQGRLKYSQLSMDEKKKLTKDATKIATIFWRLIAALPPLIGSLWAKDLSFSLLLAGVAGLYVAFFAPAFLQLESNKQQQYSKHLQQKSIYGGWYSSTLWTYPVIVFAMFSLGAVLIQIRDAVLNMR